MRIGELSSRTGLSTKALRFYEEIGVLPAAARRANGYREYGEDAVGRLGFVRAAQSVGLSLGEIRSVLAFRDEGRAPCGHVADLIRRRADEISLRIEELEAMRGTLKRLEVRSRGLRPQDCDPAAICHIIPREPPTK